MNLLRPDFARAGFELPNASACRARGRARAAWRREETHRRSGSAENSGDNSFEVFISPVLKDPIDVSATLRSRTGPLCSRLEEKQRATSSVRQGDGLEGKMTPHGRRNAQGAAREIVEEIGEYRTPS
jgi:hypothetical protein